ncbi:uncharacterized protein LOC116129558 [Pistacia vera]|uniref:uncharacterized protein LOC116129558 n=1 Tax=Pistacia vera TaxID=55513 RepID=UPI001263A6C4|nr:uncharacterized protein LOC116129558 [Pistacia vera]
MKQHLAGVQGDIRKCPKVPFDVRFNMNESLKEIGVKNKKKEDFRKHATPFGAAVHDLEGDRLDEENEEVFPSQMTMNEGGSSGGKKQFTSSKRKKTTGVSNYFAPRTTSGSQPSIRSVLVGKDAKWRADVSVARFFYDACIPMNALNSIYFQPMLDVVAAIGPGYKQPTYDSMCVNLLRDAKKEVQLIVDNYKTIWQEVGCTLMADGWTDTCHRSLINFLVYCPKGVCFIKSVDASDVVKDAFTLFKLFKEMALWVGPNNIVHVVTDNGANYKAAGRMLSDKYENITWSPCAAHCLNLILKDISELDHIVHLAQRASEVTNLHEHKHDLQAMMTDRFFVDSQYARSSKDERPAIGYVYDGMYRAKKAIKKFFRKRKTLYKPYTKIIKQRWDMLLHRNIHATAYYLNPAFQYDRATFSRKPEVMRGFLDVVDNKASAF